MNLKFTRKRGSWLVAAMLVLGLAVFAFAAVFRWQARLDYDPVVAQALAPRPASKGEGLNLHDGRVLEREMQIPAGPVTHVGIGLANLRGADTDAVIALEVQDESGASLAKGFFTLASARADDVTYVPLRFDVPRDMLVKLRIHSSGIPAGQDVSLWYEPENNGVRVEFLRRPTLWALWRSLI